MRPRYSFSSRHTSQAKDPKNIRKQRKKYPDLAEKVLESSDIILEVLDARFPNETRNTKVEKWIKEHDKKLIFVLNKADLAQNIDNPPIPNKKVSCKKRTGIKSLRDRIKMLASKIKKDDKIIVGVVGYPNTGKSSLINVLIGKNSAKTGSDAGFTKGIQKLRLTSEISLLDSPGVIPKEEYSSIAQEKLARHAKVGARSYSQIRDPEMIITQVIKEFPNLLENYYKINSEGDAEKLLEIFGRKRNILKKGNEVDVDKTARLILKDWQEGRLR